jgi:hypothetical protein
MFQGPYNPQEYQSIGLQGDPGTSGYGQGQGFQGMGQGFWGNFLNGNMGQGMQNPNMGGLQRPSMGGPILGNTGGNQQAHGQPILGPQQAQTPGLLPGGGGVGGMQGGQQTGQGLQQQGFGMYQPPGYSQQNMNAGQGYGSMLQMLFSQLFGGSPNFMYAPTNMSGMSPGGSPFGNIGSIY